MNDDTQEMELPPVILTPEDRLEVMYLTERRMRLEAQLELARAKEAGSQARLKAKYKLSERDSIDFATGAITRT